MRILFVTRKYPPSLGGMEVYSKEIFEALKRCGADIELYKPTRDIIGRPSLAQIAGFAIGAVLQMLRGRRQYDIVLLGDFAIAPLAIPAKLFSAGRTAVAVSLHGNDLYFMRKRTLLAGLYRALSRFVVGSGAIDHAIANSRAIEKEAKLRGIESISIVPLATIVPEQPARERSRSILFAGRLIRYKGLSWFVRHVWPSIDPRVELLVAGPVWDEDEKKCLDDAPRTTYLGEVPYGQLPAMRACMMACIMPNVPPAATEQDEGFGLAALEAPAVGTPIVASRCGGIPDAVVDGVTGFLLPALDAKAWAGCLNDIAQWTPERRSEFAETARRQVSEQYNWDLTADRTLTVLRSIRRGSNSDGALQ